jgi:uncharacterized membrane protein
MRSAASIGGHPLHAMLITIPAGGFLLTLVLDIVYLVTGDAGWWQATPYVLVVAVAGGLVAAIPGLIDLFTVVPKGQPMRIGLFHMGFNLAVVALFAVNTWIRWDVDDATVAAGRDLPGFALTVVGAALLAVSGWLGWTLVQTWHIGVLEEDEGGHPVRVTSRVDGSARP